MRLSKLEFWLISKNLTTKQGKYWYHYDHDIKGNICKISHASSNRAQTNNTRSNGNIL